MRKHRRDCEESPRDKSTCTCECDGEFHGIAAPSQADTSPPPDPPPPPAPPASDDDGDDVGPQHREGAVVAWLVLNWDTPSGMLSQAAATAIADEVDKAVVDSGDSWRIRSRVRRRHGLCSLLVLAVDGLAPLAEADSLVGDAVADLVVPDTHGFADTVMSEVVSHVVAELVSSALGGQLARAQDVLRALRMLAVAACPAPRRHVELWRSCAAPLAEEMTHTAVRWWILERFADGGS